MKYGFRTPSFKKSFKARTTGRLKRTYKRALNPWYGRKGMGYLHNPGKAIYNGIYHRTTVSPIPRSKTKAYRHAYYMKRKYGYVPADDWTNNVDSAPSHVLPKNRSNWTAKQTEANDKHESEDNAAMEKVAQYRREAHKATVNKIINDIKAITHFHSSSKHQLGTACKNLGLLKAFYILMYFMPFIPAGIIDGIFNPTNVALSWTIALSSILTAGVTLYCMNKINTNIVFSHLLIYSLILAVWFLLLSI